MSKYLNLKNFISLIVGLFLLGISNIYGHSLNADDATNLYTHFQNKNLEVSQNSFIKSNSFFIYDCSQDNADNLFLFHYIFENEEIEPNDKTSVYHQLIPFNGHLLSVFSSQLTSVLSKAVQRVINHYALVYKETDTKLYKKFQVFII